MERAKKIITPIIAVLCVLAIVYLLFFFGKNAMPKDELTTVALKEYSITFDKSEIDYDKSTDFMDGVTATDSNGNDLTQFVTVSCKPTNNISKKTLTYSINKSGYKILTFERSLLLNSSYNGPSIDINGSGVEVPLDRINSLSSIIDSSDIISTDDGFGTPCAISAVIQNQEEIAVGDYVATISAQNIFGDTATAKISVTVTPAESSIIKLSVSSITLNKGDEFEPLDYVISAEHEKYGDLKPYVIADEIDTSKAGIYNIEYKIEGIRELENEVTYLSVTVN